MKILLTGTSGQLGRALQTQLSGERYQQIELFAPIRAQMDLKDPQSIQRTLDDFQPDLIVNPAAYTAVDLAESEPQAAFLVNTAAPALLAKEAKSRNIGLVHFSTDYVFDGSKRDTQGALVAYTETDAPCPINIYGQSKLEGEIAIRESGCKHLIFRTSWVYSLFGKNFLLTILRLAQERDQLSIVNDQFGVPNSAAWLAESCIKILEQLGSSQNQEAWWKKNSGTYNLALSGYTSWFGFTQEILHLATSSGRLQKTPNSVLGIPASQYPTPARRPSNSILCNAKLADNFSLQIPSWQSALAICLSN
ncbi:MAG: dTDP-4-dehydrorhamnose reductase [Burkholderiaceae bacterium]|nr:dTDP-4-dehydrorhamnose reductase [Burkholderiaceae bacterium]